MAPSCYGDDKEEEVSSHGSEDQLEDDLDALRRACLLSGRDASVSSDSPDKSESEEVDDLAIVRMLQQRFSLPSTMDLTKVDGDEGTEVSDDYDEDDMEILRSVQRRFGWYQLDDSMQKASVASAPENISESQTDREGSMEDVSSSRALVPCSSGYSGETHFENLSASFIRHDPEDVNPEGISYSSSALSLKYSSFPKTARVFFEALKKNRLCQKFLRSKMIQIEALIDENRELKRRVTCLRDFQLACKRHSGRLLGQESDARVMLISLPRIVRKTKDKDGKAGMSLGPAENSHVPIFNIVRRKLPTEDRKLWSTVERESLIKGIKQQVQQCLLQNAMQVYSSEVASGDPNHLDSIIAEISNLEITPQKIRTFLPMVDWERLATMYVKGRTGAECEARWLNYEDPLINHNPWMKYEDKKLLFVVQNNGLHNWSNISETLGTNRTPSQCLSRYQRSLNAYILKKEWSVDEDNQLRAVVEIFGEDNWQLVASHMEGRTGVQCSNRWLKTLHPCRKRVGRWTVEEDKRLKVAIMLFGPRSWKKIAGFVPGRTQVQCRERWLNSLDPSLKLEEWTDGEDSKLKAAIAEHGYCWSKIASHVHPRTDSQCRRRWKVLFPEEVPVAQKARKLQKAALISNFVGREKERPAIGPDDFVPVSEENSPDSLVPLSEENMLLGASDGHVGTMNKTCTTPKLKKKRRQKGRASDDLVPVSEENVLLDPSDGHVGNMNQTCTTPKLIKKKKGENRASGDVAKRGVFKSRTKKNSLEDALITEGGGSQSNLCDSGNASRKASSRKSLNKKKRLVEARNLTTQENFKSHKESKRRKGALSNEDTCLNMIHEIPPLNSFHEKKQKDKQIKSVSLPVNSPTKKKQKKKPVKLGHVSIRENRGATKSSMKPISLRKLKQAIREEAVTSIVSERSCVVERAAFQVTDSSKERGRDNCDQNQGPNAMDENTLVPLQHYGPLLNTRENVSDANPHETAHITEMACCPLVGCSSSEPITMKESPELSLKEDKMCEQCLNQRQDADGSDVSLPQDTLLDKNENSSLLATNLALVSLAEREHASPKKSRRASRKNIDYSEMVKGKVWH